MRRNVRSKKSDESSNIPTVSYGSSFQRYDEAAVYFFKGGFSFFCTSENQL